MTSRERLQHAYELAFFPPRLHRLWSDIRTRGACDAETVELLKMALSLHQMLPEQGYSSFRALKRLSLYQAHARQFGTVTFLRNILAFLQVDFVPPPEVPGKWVRDIGLPEFRAHQTRSPV